jgi:hypothetical protein
VQTINKNDHKKVIGEIAHCAILDLYKEEEDKDDEEEDDKDEEEEDYNNNNNT